HARDPRRARLPRARRPGARLLQHAEGDERAGAPALVPGREPLGAEAAQLEAVVWRVLRLAEGARRRGSQAQGALRATAGPIPRFARCKLSSRNGILRPRFHRLWEES